MIDQRLGTSIVELADALKAEGMTDKNAYDWFEHCDKVNAALDTMKMTIGCDWLCTEMDGNVQVHYWSDKIRHTIMLDSEAYHAYETLQELSEALIILDDEARALESKLHKVVM